MYLTLPFGRRGSPAYFLVIDEGITKAHRMYTPRNKTRDGSRNLKSLLYVEDEICTEPCPGRRTDVAVSRREARRLELLGKDASNVGKLEEAEEGERSENQIFPGFELTRTAYSSNCQLRRPSVCKRS